jgi:polar amino acid transport system substrate-binding protein/glutamate/aspartate transport system substrate-binding protein
MKRALAWMLSIFVVASTSAFAETTLEKIGRAGTLTIGTRTGSPPFAYVDKNNRWIGFSIDLVEQFVAPAVSKKLGKPIKIAKKESAPPTRIPLLTSNAVDLIAETMTDTKERRESVDFSLTFFYTGAQFLVKKGSAITGIESVAGKRVAAQQGATNARVLRERVPTVKLVEFPDQPAAFQALAQGRVEAYTNDGIQLAGLKAKAPKPDDWAIVGQFYSTDPYGMAMRKNEPDFRNLVNQGLADAIESGKYFELYDKYFGAKGELPYPMTAEMKRQLQASAAEFRKAAGAQPAKK